MAANNKHSIFSIKGSIDNYSSALASHNLFSVFDRSAQVSFNFCKKNVLPLGGASYTLSRMSSNVGMYLALTGDEISGLEAAIYQMGCGVHDKFETDEAIRTLN